MLSHDVDIYIYIGMYTYSFDYIYQEFIFEKFLTVGSILYYVSASALCVSIG